jgi:hypothetical protein
MKVRSAALIVALLYTSPSAFAENCRNSDGAPPGVRLQPPPGCEVRAERSKSQTPASAQRAGRDPGFIELGNGSQLRISGRVRVDALGRR